MKLDKIAVFDVETTFSDKDNDPSAFVFNNEVVLSGLYLPTETAKYDLTSRTSQCHGTPDFKKFNINLIVGFALHFDLHWAYRYDKTFLPWVAKNSRVWDCQLAEYLLSNMTMKFPSLDYCAEKRGGTKKLTTVPDLWAAGVSTRDIPRWTLTEYLAGDLRNTYIIFCSQVAEATERGMLTLIMQQQEFLLSTIEMTYNGMSLDPAVLTALGDKFRESREATKKALTGMAASVGLPGFNPSSADQVGTVLHGGVTTVTTKKEVGVYKSGVKKGTPSFTKVVKTVAVPGFGLSVLKRTATGAPCTDDVSLTQLLGVKCLDRVARTFLETMQLHRNFEKQLTTYVEGIPKHLSYDGRIHHRLNHCVTNTGRLSSSNPNLQNVSDGPFKAAFIPPPGYEYLVEHDFSQLELVSLAYLSKDPALILDIRLGTDMHSYFYKKLFGKPPTAEQRKQFKRLMFGLIYGAGVSKLSETSGLHKDVCERFISGFYHRYGRVKWYHDNIAEVADASGKHTGERDQAGHPIRTFLHRSNTGRVYHFHEYEIPWKAGTYGFSPTELKNRPVQGWATADIVPLAIGLLYRYNACKSTPAHLLNTVHDSVLVACRTEFDAVEWAVEAKIILESVQREYEEAYSTALPLPFKVASSIGKNWLDMKPYPYEED